jgi:hypothetical protein
MTKKRILGCLRVPPGVRVTSVEYHCPRAQSLFDKSLCCLSLITVTYLVVVSRQYLFTWLSMYIFHCVIVYLSI